MTETLYMLRVLGNSMLNPSGRPSLADGDIITVDPDRDAPHGSIVVATLEDSPFPILRQLVIEDDRRYLRTLNPAWPEPMTPIGDEVKVIGVVIGKWSSLIEEGAP